MSIKVCVLINWSGYQALPLTNLIPPPREFHGSLHKVNADTHLTIKQSN